MVFIKANFLFLILAWQIQAAARPVEPDSLIIHQKLNQAYRLIKVNSDSAMALYREAIALADSQKIISQTISSARVRLANYEYYRGNTSPAITQALGAMEFYKQKGDPLREAGTMILVADILRATRLFDQAFAYLSEAQKMSSEFTVELPLRDH